jgi:excisionase family DNA binding protein
MSPAKAPVGLLTVEQVAAYLQFSPSTVEQLIRDGALKRFALSDRDSRRGGPGRRGYRVHPDDLAAFVDSRRRAETPRAEDTPKAPTPRMAPATGTDGKSRLRRPGGR